MRGIRNLVWISIAAMLVMSMAGLGHSDPAIYVRVIPEWSTGIPGETFVVHIKAGAPTGDPVKNLFVAEFWMAFDRAVIDVVDDPLTTDIEGITEDVDNPIYLEKIYYEELKYGTGWSEMRVAVGRPLGVKEGLNGTVGIAKITFVVKGYSSKSILKLYLTRLLTVVGADIKHYVMDGRFKNIYPILWIKKKGAHGVGVWPEWTGAVWYEGLTNTLYSKVANTGDEPATFRVRFVFKESPIGTFSVVSGEGVVTPGEATAVSATVKFGALYLPPGDYDFTGVLEWKIEPGAIPPVREWVTWEEFVPLFGGAGSFKDVGQGKFTAK